MNELKKDDGLRLSKHLASAQGLSRAEAESYIEGGFVTVNGVVIESPQHRVTGSGGTESILLSSDAKLTPSLPMTLLLHKPSGVPVDAALQLVTAQSRASIDRSGTRLLQKHLKAQACVTPLETGASGLVVFTQDFPVKRKLIDDGHFVEHELIVDVVGAVSEPALRGLNRPPMKVAISKQNERITGLRFAIKGFAPGSIAAQCAHVGVELDAIKRIRIGRIPLAGLEAGQWRFLMGYERF